MFKRRFVDRPRYDITRHELEPCSDSRSLSERCSGCGMLFETVFKAGAGLPELLAIHLANSPECVEKYCEEPDNLVDLEAGKLGIRQTLFICKYAGGSGVAGIAPCGERRVFYFDPRRKRAEAWLAERMDGGTVNAE